MQEWAEVHRLYHGEHLSKSRIADARDEVSRPLPQTALRPPQGFVCRADLMSRPGSDVAFLSRALKAPRIRELAPALAVRAHEESWDYEAYLAGGPSEEVASRETHGGSNRVRAARFPQVKTLDDFDFSFQRSVKRTQIAHLPQRDFLAEAHNVVFLGSAGHRQEPPVDRSGGSGRSPRPPGGLRHGSRVGASSWSRQTRRQAGG